MKKFVVIKRSFSLVSKSKLNVNYHAVKWFRGSCSGLIKCCIWGYNDRN